MGDTVFQDTHVKRSSSLSFALQGKHENLRLISIVSSISVVFTFLFLLLLYGSTAKSVTVIVNGEPNVVHTNQWMLKRLLAEQDVAVGEHDRVSVPLDSTIHSGQTIVIDQAKPIEVTVDGESKTMYTIGKNVGGALQDLQIALGADDKLSQAVDAPVTDGMQLQITRVKKEVAETTEPIAFDVVKQNDPKLPKGKEEVVQDGQEGILLKKVEKVYEDGQLVAENVVDQSVQQDSVNKVVAVGTKNPVTVLSASSPAVDQVTKDDVAFDAKQILSNVTLTAYSAGPASTGKSPSDSGYGVTSSGARVTEGRTIAVDPKVIPLGWWVYIDGLGFRRAEDTGSAIKGNKIDVYFDSESYANKFGTKRGYTVYVIGPKKPTAD